MAVYYLIDPLSRRLRSGPHVRANEKDPVPIGAVFTDITPPDPGAGEIVLADGEGGWEIVAGAPSTGERIHPDRIHRGSYATLLLTPQENDDWIALVDAARQTPVADRTEAQRNIIRQWTHFELHEYLTLSDPRVQGAAYGLRLYDVLKTDERADQLARGVIVSAEQNNPDRVPF